MMKQVKREENIKRTKEKNKKNKKKTNTKKEKPTKIEKTQETTTRRRGFRPTVESLCKKQTKELAECLSLL